MFRYAQINESGFVVSDSFLGGEVTADHMIAIAEDFVLTNKKYVDGQWVEYVPEPIVEVPTEEELVNAEILLNQVTQEARLTAIDEVLAVILLNSTGGALNV
ncbi:MAG TPA: flagellar basal-body rod protein [Lachnospiraceae bacterium]|nr:flagellar basal-body rod protein [Lachnospiraceae bacterium]